MIERLRIIWYSRMLNKIPPNIHYYLHKYNEYYNNLSPALKKRFRERLYITNRFLKYKPVDFDIVTEEMKVLISSALIMMTFGLEKFILRRFTTIYVVPNTYSYLQYQALLGHVDYNKNIIAMSWPSVKNGFIIPDDALNVALHELAHALQQENYDRPFFADFFSELTMAKWNKEGVKELFKIRKHQHDYLRDYAGKNMVELFSVCMESFFEQPVLFNQHVPKLYRLMCRLLKQNPINSNNPLKIL